MLKTNSTTTHRDDPSFGDPALWLTKAQLQAAYPQLWPTVRSLEWDLRFRATNGLGPFVKILGKRSLLHRTYASNWKLSTATAFDRRRA